MLARAFRDNPLNRTVVGPSERRRLRCNEAGMRAQLGPALARGEVLAARDGEGAIQGVLVGVPPGAWPLPLPALGARLRLLWRQGVGVAGRWATVARRLEDVHPIVDHAYLATLGVAPEQAGRGVGTKLLGAWLAGVDAAGVPAYLETDEARNVPFYTRAGFEVVRELSVLGVAVHALERPPAGAGVDAVGG